MKNQQELIKPPSKFYLLGHKIVIGRTSIGGGNQCTSQGLDHWLAMTSTPGHVVEKRHKLI